MAKGIGIGIGIPSGALNSNAAIGELLANLCARSTYCENKPTTNTILQSLENCTS